MNVSLMKPGAANLLLCQRLKLPLATLDERLKPGAARAQVKLFEI